MSTFLEHGAALIAAAILEMRKAESKAELDQTLIDINAIAANICANVALELDYFHRGDQYMDAIERVFTDGVRSLVAEGRQMRTHLVVPETEVVN